LRGAEKQSDAHTAAQRGQREACAEAARAELVIEAPFAERAQ
jgi:hypothetical protein